MRVPIFILARVSGRPGHIQGRGKAPTNVATKWGSSPSASLRLDRFWGSLRIPRGLRPDPTRHIQSTRGPGSDGGVSERDTSRSTLTARLTNATPAKMAEETEAWETRSS